MTLEEAARAMRWPMSDLPALRRLVAAAQKQNEVLKEVAAFRLDRDMEDGEKPFNVLDYDALEMWSSETQSAIAAVDVDAIERVLEAAKEVVYWDWSDNDKDAVATVDQLRSALAALDLKKGTT